MRKPSTGHHSSQYSREDVNGCISSPSSIVASSNSSCDTVWRRLASAPVVSSHGYSKLHVCCFHGGINWGKRCNTIFFERFIPALSYVFNSMSMQIHCNYFSLKGFVISCVLPILFPLSTMQEVAVGGWSLGGLIAFHTGLEIEACLSQLRGLFSLDTLWIIPPYVDQVPRSLQQGTCCDREF